MCKNLGLLPYVLTTDSFQSIDVLKIMERKMELICYCFYIFVGHYVYIETSSPRVKGDKAWLLSQSFNSFSGHGRCMSFWYHMYGTGIGENTNEQHHEKTCLLGF